MSRKTNLKQSEPKAIWQLSKGHAFARPGQGRGGKHQDKTRYNRKQQPKPEGGMRDV